MEYYKGSCVFGAGNFGVSVSSLGDLNQSLHDELLRIFESMQLVYSGFVSKDQQWDLIKNEVDMLRYPQEWGVIQNDSRKEV